ncbi:testicular acid phosphatase homolog isoform X2 [Sitodiplosis mosellana]|uniref:testicular acid phosphatase homolog isoform X2 n=1 Tax=Sitodiplosis mosellana TaxID=263140 RepID=UPI0024442188|nr:testicular acid phosphatase homolog isoform X2 [Sitodiplosis mosellana]
MNKAVLYQNSNGVQRNDAEQVFNEFSSVWKWRSNGRDTLLDVGCGSGDVTIDLILPFLPDNFERLVECDISDEMVNHARHKKGKQQEYKLGQFLKRRYNKLIGDKYSPDKVYVRSTDYDRTIMSALVNLAGLYPPTGDDIWNEDISNWQPIPVHTIPLIADYVLYGPKNCSKYDAVFQEYIKNSPEVQKLQTKYQQLLKFWSKMCGSDIKTIGDASLLYNTLYIENLHNKSLAAWAQKAIEPNGIMEYMAKFYFQMGSATPQLARLRTGFLIKEMLERFTQKINATLSPDRSLWLYSSHDLMISNMLNTLGLFKKTHFTTDSIFPVTFTKLCIELTFRAV